jgi:dextranase
VTDFDPSRVDIETTACWLAKHHINGLQFYDWMYRHEDLLPSSEIFLDPMGRRLSLVTVKRLVDAVHARGIAALPYAAVYAASPAFFRRHPDWALLDGESRPILFGDDFLVIMNPAAGSPWTAHMMAQFDRILQEIAFDGVHLDQYGDPRSGYDARGEPVDLAHAFPAFIDATREVVRRRRGCTGAVVFNAVANWPVEAVAPAGEDVVYVEVWPEYTDEYATYRDLHRVVVEGGRAGGGKPVVLAAYVDPARERNVLLSDAVVFASGGFRIELGERGRMLADPYFPKHGRMGNGLIDRVRSYYDFAVRYESVLSLGTRDATEESAGSLAVEGTGPSAGEPCPGVWPIVRSGAGFEAISLVNLPLAGGARWDTPHDGWPEPLTDLCVRCSAGRRVARAWWASPDGGCCRAQPLDLAAGSNGEEIVLPVPRLDCWTLIVLEWAET